MHTLGDELISNERVAVLELVKNGYDADAGTVLVRFSGRVENAEGRIEIVDDGHGMSLERILEAWSEPATSVKRIMQFSPAGRRVVGEKGVGRFAAARLGRELELVTRAAGSDREVRLLVDWTAFDRQDYLDQVEFLWEEGTPREISDDGNPNRSNAWLETGTPPGHGTILRISGLFDSWSRETLTQLRAALARLASPFRENSDFQVFLHVPAYPDLSGQVQPPPTLSSPDYSIEGAIRADGTYSLKYSDREGEQVLEGTFTLDGRRLPESGPFEVVLRVWDRDRDSITDLSERLGVTVRDVQRDLNEAAGVSIYRDSFRVLPYGEIKTDWLGLDIRRVQNPTMRVSNNQVVGYILIGADANPALRDQSNREGLIASPAFEDLRPQTQEVLALLESRRYKVRHRPEKSEPQRGLFQGFELSSLRDYARTKYPQDVALARAVDVQERTIAAQVERVRSVFSRYSRLATLGQLVDVVLHDGRTLLSAIGHQAELGRQAAAKSRQDPAVAALGRRFAEIVKNTDLLFTFFRRIEPFGGRVRARPRKVGIEGIIRDSIGIFHARIREMKVQYEISSTNTQMRVVPSEIQQIIVNLLDNSLYWLSKVPANERRIVIEVNRNGADVVLLFSDSGPGVPAEFQDRIFDPYFSTRPDGVGLGLTIAGEAAVENSGRLELVGGCALPGACFQLTLPAG